MKLYAGIDLHSNNSYVTVIDKTEKIVYQKRIENDLKLLLKELAPYQERLEDVVVESTYNWYWLVDGLQEAGYRVRLAHTLGNQQYSGKKYTDDKSDAEWLARLSCLKILKEGHIYPKEKRGLRELLRRRLLLVRQQTRNVLGIQALITRYENVRISASQIKNCQEAEEKKMLSYIKDNDVRLATQSQLKVLRVIIEQISILEKAILSKIKKDAVFKLLKTVPGVGDILAMTILLETGSINRFKSAGCYSSYCRCVGSKRISNEKKKGKNNSKNGNAYLAWAFIEAANCAVRAYEPIKCYYQRKMQKTHRVLALKVVASKLAKACYFMLRDGVNFNMAKLFF